MAKVFIGVDPHKLSATIEVVDAQEVVLAVGRFGTDEAGYAAMRKTVSRWPERVWAVEGSNGAGRPLAQRLLADGEPVVDVPAKLSARARLFDTGHNRKTDAYDAHAVAVVAVRTAGLRALAHDDELEALRMLVDRRDELTRTRVQTVNRLHRLLSELTPGQAKKDLTALQAKRILAGVRPRDLAGKTRVRSLSLHSGWHVTDPYLKVVEPGEVSFAFGAIGPNLRVMPPHLLQAMPMLTLALTALVWIGARWLRLHRNPGQAAAVALRDLWVGLALAGSWAAIWGVYATYTWTTDPTSATVQVVRFYLPAIGAVSLLGAWLVTRIPGPAWLAALISTTVIAVLFAQGTWAFHDMYAAFGVPLSS